MTYHSPLGQLFRQCLANVEVNLFETISDLEYVIDEEFGDYIHAEVERRMAIADEQVRVLLDEGPDHDDWTYQHHNEDDWEAIYTEQIEFLSQF